MEQPPKLLGWENLVTDGHVRAARIRRAQPYLVTLAVICMLVGWVLLTSVRASKSENNRTEVLGAEVDRQQRKAIDAFAYMPPPRIGQSQLAKLPSAENIPEIQKKVLDELNRVGDVPADLKIETVEPSAFWRVPWKAGQFVSAAGGGVRIVGAVVNTGSSDYPDPARWMAVFRRASGDWQVATISGPDFISVPETLQVVVGQIPVTLSPILKTKE